jgi:hypothetical protein
VFIWVTYKYNLHIILISLLPDEASVIPTHCIKFNTLQDNSGQDWLYRWTRITLKEANRREAENQRGIN